MSAMDKPADRCTLCGRTEKEKCSAATGHEWGTPAAPVTPVGWKSITPRSGDGDRGAIGTVDPTMKIELRPCAQCRSFSKEKLGQIDLKLVRHFADHGCTIHPNGTVTTPIAKDIPGRKSLTLDLRVFGWCKLDTMPVDEQATCRRWVPIKALKRGRAA